MPPSSGDAAEARSSAAVEITNHSTSDQPDATGKEENVQGSVGVLRAAMSPALVPARNTNTGAQKCVIQRVKNKSRTHIGIVHEILV